MADELEQQPAATPSAAPSVVTSVGDAPASMLNPNFTRGYGTGRRKESVARVYLLPGNGKITINGREFAEFFPLTTLQKVVTQPLVASETAAVVDVRATVRGGGLQGQAGAVRLGISRALLEYNIELRKRLKKLGMLTRDSRVHERKKYGQKGARKRFQFSKR
jgi:small subunit ribosomal protein S9